MTEQKETKTAVEKIHDAYVALCETKPYYKIKAEAEKLTEPEKPDEPTEPAAPEELNVGNEELYHILGAVIELVKFVCMKLIPFLVSLA